MLESPYTSDDDEMNTGVSKSTCFEPTIKNLMNETVLCHKAERNLVSRRHNIRVKISIIKNYTEIN